MYKILTYDEKLKVEGLVVLKDKAVNVKRDKNIELAISSKDVTPDHIAGCIKAAVESVAQFKLKTLGIPVSLFCNSGIDADSLIKDVVYSVSEYDTPIEVIIIVDIDLNKQTGSILEKLLDDKFVDCVAGADRMKSTSSKRATTDVTDGLSKKDIALCKHIYLQKNAPKDELAKFLDEPQEKFEDVLFRYIDERGLKDSEVYKKANVDRRVFSKIRSQKNFTPKKNDVLKIAIVLKLNLSETIDLLARIGKSFDPRSISDRIVEYHIVHGIYDVDEVNIQVNRYTSSSLED